jgi:uncharacterized membrane protein
MSLLWITVATLLALVAIISLVDLIRHAGRHSGWGIAGWAALIVVLPVFGSLLYWARRQPSQDEVESARLAEESMRQQAAHRPL